MPKQIPPARMAAYYVGLGLMIVGVLLFASIFVSFAANFGDFSNFEDRVKSNMFSALGGMALIVVGGLIRSVGARGLAGSGVLLDPDLARRDLEPHSRMVGGMVKDVLDAADVKLGGSNQKVVMIKCASCSKLNEEDSKFCQQCGKPL